MNLKGRAVLHPHSGNNLQPIRHGWQILLRNEDNVITHRKYFDWIAHKLDIKTQADWYKIKAHDIKQNHGMKMLKDNYRRSHIVALQTVYPEYTWHPWLFSRVPENFWTTTTEKQFLLWLQEELELESKEDWYKVSNEVVKEKGGGVLLQNHNGSLMECLMDAIPEYDLKPWFSQDKVLWKNKQIQRNYMEWLRKELGISKSQHWHLVSTEDVKEHSGTHLLSLYNGSLIQLLREVLPEDELFPSWLPSSDENVDFWKHNSNMRKYLDWFSETVGIQHQDDWYSISPSLLSNRKGTGLIHHFAHSMIPLYEMCHIAYPEFEWYPFRFSKSLTLNFWEDIHNQRLFFDEFSSRFNVHLFDDWKSVSESDVREFGGGTLLDAFYRGSIPLALQHVYPQYEWTPWLFEQKLPPFFWTKETQQKYFEWLTEHLNIEQQEDFYGLTFAMIRGTGGYGIIQHYNESLYESLSNVFPEFTWYPWLFAATPSNYWDSREHQRKCLDWLAEQLNIQLQEEWYSVSVVQIRENGAGGLLGYFKDSPMYMLWSAFPEFEWFPWNSKTPMGFWSDISNHRKCMDWLATQLGITKKEQWYRVSRELFLEHNCGGILSQYKNSVIRILQTVYPEHEWIPRYHTLSPGQWEVYELIRGFTGAETLMNYKQQIPLRDLFVGEFRHDMELDVYIPSMKLAFEYQGPHHYEPTNVTSYSRPHLQRTRDWRKSQACKRLGISLVEIPYWWSSSILPFLASIKQSYLGTKTSQNDSGEA